MDRLRMAVTYARRAMEYCAQRCGVQPGYAKRWMRHNWWRLLYALVWMCLGIVIREAAASSRPERWPVGSEMIPSALCWALAVRVAAGEIKIKQRRTQKWMKM